MLINILILLIVDKSKIYKLLTKHYCMKHYSKFHGFLDPLPKQCCVDLSKNETHHELSYYLNGGIDLRGDALSKDGDAEFDTEEEADAILAEGASAVALGDPRQSKFRIVEDLGKALAKKSTAGNPKPFVAPTEGAGIDK